MYASRLLTAGRQLRTTQTATENISVCKLTDHSTSWLLTRGLETLLLTYLLSRMAKQSICPYLSLERLT